MVESTQAATQNSSINYSQFVQTLVKMWDLYRTAFVVTFVILLLATIVFVIRKSSWGKWFLFLTIFTGASILALDGLKQYVVEKKKAAIKKVIFAPITYTVGGIGKIMKGIFGFGK
jgi:hypothetical protein